MSTSTPSYVRLSDRLARSVLVDLPSGWSISGLDVLPFPTTPRQAKFVKVALRDGRLEAASKAEYDEIQQFNEQSRQQLTGFLKPEDVAKLLAPHQEHAVRQNAAGLHHDLLAQRGLAEPGELSAKADRARKQRLLAEQRGEDDEPDEDDDETTDDDAPEVQYETLKAPALKKMAKERGLPTTGTQAELAARLREFDAEQGEDDDGDDD